MNIYIQIRRAEYAYTSVPILVTTMYLHPTINAAFQRENSGIVPKCHSNSNFYICIYWMTDCIHSRFRRVSCAPVHTISTMVLRREAQCCSNTNDTRSVLGARVKFVGRLNVRHEFLVMLPKTEPSFGDRYKMSH